MQLGLQSQGDSQPQNGLKARCPGWTGLAHTVGIPHRGPVLCSFWQMMQFAWANYRRYAMGKNELRPLSKDGYQGHIFGESLGHLDVAGEAGHAGGC